MSDKMSAEPVAWMDSRDIEESKYEGNQYDDKPRQALMHPFVERTMKKGLGRLRFDTPLYAESPAQARAMAIAEAARECEETYPEYRGNEVMEYLPCYSTPRECAAAIRALSSPPSVTEEWVEQRLKEAYSMPGPTPHAAVRATLAALGVTVEGAAK